VLWGKGAASTSDHTQKEVLGNCFPCLSAKVKGSLQIGRLHFKEACFNG